jgi:hypothetical protein
MSLARSEYRSSSRRKRLFELLLVAESWVVDDWVPAGATVRFEI